MARRPSQSGELVRLSPLQFSLSVSIVVVLLAGAGLVGYYYGLKQATRLAGVKDAGSTVDPHVKTEPKSEVSGITFYSALTEPRKEVPTAPISPLAETTSTPVKAKPAALPDSGKRESMPGNGSVLLQVASYRDNSSASKLLQDLSLVGYAGTVVRAELGDRGIWYRVRIGPYSTEKEAGSILQKLRKERSLKGYIVK